MVSLVKKKVVLRTKSKGNKEKVREKELDAHVFDYGESRLLEGAGIVVSVAVATFVLKEEDRHQVIRLTDDAAFGKSSFSGSFLAGIGINPSICVHTPFFHA